MFQIFPTFTIATAVPIAHIINLLCTPSLGEILTITMYSSGFLSNRRLAVSLICLRMSTKIDVLLRISINRINLISTHLIKAMSSNLPGSVALMNKLRSDPFSFLDRFNDSASDPVFQMRLMRAFAEKQINPLDVIDASNLSTDSNLRLCVGAYEELKHMEKALNSYPEKLTQLEEISQRNRLFKVSRTYTCHKSRHLIPVQDFNQ